MQQAGYVSVQQMLTRTDVWQLCARAAMVTLQQAAWYRWFMINHELEQDPTLCVW